MEPIVTTSDGSVGTRIWRVCLDMHATKRAITRQDLVRITGLKLTIIDDHVKRLKNEGKLRLVVNGVFEPVIEYREDRAISTTILPDGDTPVKIEIGDTVLELSWREARNLGIGLGGIGLLFKS